MRRSTKILCVAIAVALIMSLSAAWGAGGKESSSTSAAAALDTSKFETLKVVLMGDAPNTFAAVSAKLNEMAKKDLNINIEWQFLSWDNWQNKYNVKLSSGETVDLIYTANWADYLPLASKGAFLPLDGLVAKYAPVTWTTMDKSKWDAAKVNGKIYTVPNDWKEYKNDGIEYRVDLAKAWGIKTPITTWDQFGQYLAAAKQHSPDLIPFNEQGVQLAQSMRDMAKGKVVTVASQDDFYAVAKTNDDPTIINWYATPAFEQVAKIARDYYQAGYWSKSVMSNTTRGDTLFNDGQTFAAKSNATGARGQGQTWNTTHPDWEVGIFLASDTSGVVHPNASIGNGVALPRTCSDPPRALALIDKIRYNKAYYYLTSYGLEGQDYKLGPTGGVIPIPSANGSTFSMQPWGWHVDSMEAPVTNEWKGWAELTTRLDKILTPNKTDGFAFDPTPVNAQLAAMEQVKNQYIFPLLAGISESGDVHADVVRINDMLKKAGIDQFMAEVQKQLSAYWKQMGY